MPTLTDDLVATGLCARETLERLARELAGRGGGRLTDALVLEGGADEKAVLRVLALRAGTRFVTQEKLRATKIDQDVLDRLPVRFAEAQSAIPLKFDPATQTLLVAAADPGDAAFTADLKIVVGLDNVVLLVALERAIQAAIRRFYYGDVGAFEALAAETAPAKLPPQPGRDSIEASLSSIFKTPGKR
ncbi:MAG: GspE/PulE/PilB domain-containing protein [Deltaproteobacteria bacterium]